MIVQVLIRKFKKHESIIFKHVYEKIQEQWICEDYI